MSIAVSYGADSAPHTWVHDAPGGARASSDLIPAVLDLLQQAGLRLSELDAICFGSGPGSFTGLRTACSVAQGLAFGAGVPVLPVDSLLAVAEEARHTALAHWQAGVVTALLDARMDEMYAASFEYQTGQWKPLQSSRLIKPEQLPSVSPDVSISMLPWVLAGNVFEEYGPRLPTLADGTEPVPRITALPRATAMLRLAPQLLAKGYALAPEHALPSYIRDKVAKTTAERMAEKAAALAHTQTGP